MKTISLTVPMDYNALTRASDMLHGLAVDLSKETVSAGPAPEPVATVTETASPAPAPVAETPAPVEPEAAQVFADPAPVASVAEQPADPVQPAPVAESAPTAAPAGVDTAPAYTNPAVMVPWDARIHSGTPTKLAKKPHNWKKKRGVDDALVAQVEAELIQAMQASPANPVDPKPTPAPTVDTATAAATSTATQTSEPAPAPAPVQTAQPAATPAQPAATGGVTTFPELMAAITSKAIDQATVLAAVNKQGLQALPLLAARPDLIPAVAAELGV